MGAPIELLDVIHRVNAIQAKVNILSGKHLASIVMKERGQKLIDHRSKYLICHRLPTEYTSRIYDQHVSLWRLPPKTQAEFRDLLGKNREKPFNPLSMIKYVKCRKNKNSKTSTPSEWILSLDRDKITTRGTRQAISMTTLLSQQMYSFSTPPTKYSTSLPKTRANGSIAQLEVLQLSNNHSKRDRAVKVEVFIHMFMIKGEQVSIL